MDCCNVFSFVCSCQHLKWNLLKKSDVTFMGSVIVRSRHCLVHLMIGPIFPIAKQIIDHTQTNKNGVNPFSSLLAVLLFFKSSKKIGQHLCDLKLLWDTTTKGCYWWPSNTDGVTSLDSSAAPLCPTTSPQPPSPPPPLPSLPLRWVVVQ